MTEAEAKALKVGSVVMVEDHRQRTYTAVVVNLPNRYSDFWGLRRVGRGAGGRLHSLVKRGYLDMELVGEEAGRANVLADWLDDHDEPRAAAKLREAFPLGDQSEGT